MVKESNKNKPEGVPSGLPLLYSKPAQLDAVRHLQSTIKSSATCAFAKNTNSLPLNAIEFIEASKNYPIVFTGDENTLPAAIVGFEQENYFVGKDDTWRKNTYVPAYVRQYPFVFVEKPADKKFYLCVDEASPNFSPKAVEGANRLYSKDGEPTEFTNNALKFCTSFYQHHLITRNFCADLNALKLLQPYSSEAALASGKKARLSGFKMIDEKVLNALSNKEHLSLREKGWLPFIYLALASASNWKSLASMHGEQ